MNLVPNQYYRNAAGTSLVPHVPEPPKKLTESRQAHGRILTEQSSKVGQPRMGGLSSSTQDRIFPRIEFWKRMEYYLTIGRVGNVVESYVLDIMNREWYFDDVSDGAYEKQIKTMEKWVEQNEFGKLIATLTRNWIINGVNIVSPKDWEFLQLQSIRAKSRDNFGNTEFYYQYINGQEIKIPAKEFIEEPFIELDREPWGVGMFDSLMNKDYTDVDGKDPQSILELYRQALQDNMKIHHKFASPRVIYTVPNASTDTIDNDIAPIVEGMRNGDRAIFNEEIEIKQETVDGNARFIEHVNKIIDEVDSGLQSSANRVIAEPSAMADAREAGSADDDRTLGIMDKIRTFVNKHIIPSVLGIEAGLVVMKWGSKDAFDIEFPEALKSAIDTGVLSKEKVIIMLEEQYHWKIPTDEDVIERFGRPEVEPDEEPEKPIQAESHSPKYSEAAQKEKLIAYQFLNQKLRELS